MPKIGISKNQTTSTSRAAVLADALFSGTQQRVLGLLFGQPERSFYATELINLAGVGSGGFRHLCKKCVGQLDFVEPPHCTTCGSPFYGEVEGDRGCPNCEGLHPAFREGRTAVLFKGPARALVIELKYHRGLHVLADMEEIFRRATHVRELARGAVVVPVPLHPRKLRERGYNQAALLAEILARVAGGGARVEGLSDRVLWE